MRTSAGLPPDCLLRAIPAKMYADMDDDFGTVNLRRGDKTREMDVLRQHRDSLLKMLADVDAQLEELEMFHTGPGVVATPPPPPSAPRSQHPARRGVEAAPAEPSGPFARPLVTTAEYDEPGAGSPGGGARVLLVLAAGVLALVLIGWFIWRASLDEPQDEAVAGGTIAEITETVPAEETDTIAPASIALTITPRSHDVGLVRKGTRVTRQYEIANTTEEPISISVSRSACRCLFYEYAAVIPPKAKESLTVTVDGARAKEGQLRETLKVTAKGDPAVEASFDVIATIR